MNFKQLHLSVYALVRQRNMAFLFGIWMLFSNVLMGIMLLQKESRVVVTPAYSGEQFWVSNKGVSQEYLSEMSLFIANQLLDVSSESIAFQRSVVLKHIDTSFVREMNKRLLEDEKRYKKEGLATSFRPMEIKVDKANLSVLIKGFMSSYVVSKRVKLSLDTYEMKYHFKNGQLFLESFELVTSEDKHA